MLTLDQIAAQYPVNLQPFRRSLIVEYLQCKILEIIFNSKIATKLSFLGGTSLRLIYNNNRFSEDLDFDNFNLTAIEFKQLSQLIKKGLEAEGLNVEVSMVTTGALRCNIRLPRLLFESGLSGHQDEKILIHVDSVSQGFKYAPERKLLNRFDVFSEVFVTPLDILLSQKIYAALNRRRAKGRDFFDIVFLSSITTPNYPYLKQKLNISNKEQLTLKMKTSLKHTNFKDLSQDVSSFLFKSSDVRKVELFPEFIDQLG